MKIIILLAVFASAFAGVVQQAVPAPQTYSHSIPAAAIRNVETVGVTKTITPVVTKTTTSQTHSEPAVSVGHVQGYSQSSVGAPLVQPVQYNTQYTAYQNPTVGVNGPVTYAGPAHSVGVAAVAAPAQYAYAQPALGVGYAQHAGHAQFAYAQPAYAHQAAFAQPAAIAGHGHGLYSVQPTYSAAAIQPQFLFGSQLSSLSYAASPVAAPVAVGHSAGDHAVGQY